MATYEYHCGSCSHDFVRNERVSEHGRSPVTCPKCRSPKVGRVFTPFYAKTVRKS
ncbi:MAG: FmdB family zinc ribbon protein [Gemmatimonadales bacterium]